MCTLGSSSVSTRRRVSTKSPSGHRRGWGPRPEPGHELRAPGGKGRGWTASGVRSRGCRGGVGTVRTNPGPTTTVVAGDGLCPVRVMSPPGPTTHVVTPVPDSQSLRVPSVLPVDGAILPLSEPLLPEGTGVDSEVGPRGGGPWGRRVGPWEGGWFGPGSEDRPVVNYGHGAEVRWLH